LRAWRSLSNPQMGLRVGNAGRAHTRDDESKHGTSLACQDLARFG